MNTDFIKEKTLSKTFFNPLGFELEDPSWEQELFDSFAYLSKERIFKEAQNCRDYWLNNKKKVKRPKIALKNWLIKVKNYDLAQREIEKIYPNKEYTEVNKKELRKGVEWLRQDLIKRGFNIKIENKN